MSPPLDQSAEGPAGMAGAAIETELETNREPDASEPFKPTPLSVSSSSTSEETPTHAAASPIGDARSDSHHTNADIRVSITSTSGTVYESVVVVRHIYGSDNVVYYLLEVRASDAPLDGYVIRRRYNDFKQLHLELLECMAHRQTRRALPFSNPFGLYYTSFICNPLRRDAPEQSPLWSPPSPRGAKTTTHRRSCLGGMRNLHGANDFPETPRLHDTENDVRYSAPAIVMAPTRAPAWGYHTEAVELPMEAVEYDEDGRPLLPPMPSGGISSFFMTRDALIQYRVEQFNKILAAALSDTSTAVTQVLMKFISDNPRAQQGHYVSLNQYATIDMPYSVERVARRRAVSQGKKGLREQMGAAFAS